MDWRAVETFQSSCEAVTLLTAGMQYTGRLVLYPTIPCPSTQLPSPPHMSFFWVTGLGPCRIGWPSSPARQHELAGVGSDSHVVPPTQLVVAGRRVAGSPHSRHPASSTPDLTRTAFCAAPVRASRVTQLKATSRPFVALKAHAQPTHPLMPKTRPANFCTDAMANCKSCWRLKVPISSCHSTWSR